MWQRVGEVDSTCLGDGFHQTLGGGAAIDKHEVIEISAGAYGLGLKVERDALLKYLRAEVKDIVKDEL